MLLVDVIRTEWHPCIEIEIEETVPVRSGDRHRIDRRGQKKIVRSLKKSAGVLSFFLGDDYISHG